MFFRFHVKFRGCMSFNHMIWILNDRWFCSLLQKVISTLRKVLTRGTHLWECSHAKITNAMIGRWVKRSPLVTGHPFWPMLLMEDWVCWRLQGNQAFVVPCKIMQKLDDIDNWWVVLAQVVDSFGSHLRLMTDDSSTFCAPNCCLLHSFWISTYDRSSEDA